MPTEVYSLPNLTLSLILAIPLAFFCYLIISLSMSYGRKKKEEEYARDEAYKKAIIILEEAKNKSLNIIKESNERAKRMIKETDLAVDESKDFVHGQLKTAAEELRTSVLKETEQFRTELHKDALQTEQELRDKVAKEYMQIEAELEAYKKERMKEIDKKSLDVIVDVVREYFSKTMRVEDHVEFIRQLLDKHKKPFDIEA